MPPLVEDLASRQDGWAEEYKKRMGDKHLIGHVGKPDDVAYAVLYLASDESAFTTGVPMVVDGGYTAQ